MAQHVKVLGILHIIFGCLGLMVGLGLFLLFGGIAGLAGANSHDGDALIAVPILGGLGLVIFIAIALISLPGIIAGWGLLSFQPWARILTIILSCLELLHIPFGTALGVYGLWVLLSVEGQALFAHPPVVVQR
jgi:hypothetical protein